MPEFAVNGQWFRAIFPIHRRGSKLKSVRDVFAASGDLVNRATLTNLVNTNATVYFRDSAATNLSRQFYLAVVR